MSTPIAAYFSFANSYILLIMNSPYEKKLIQLEKLIASTPYEGERFIAKKKYAKLKAKYVSKKQKRDIWYALHHRQPDPPEYLAGGWIPHKEGMHGR